MSTFNPIFSLHSVSMFVSIKKLDQYPRTEVTALIVLIQCDIGIAAGVCWLKKIVPQNYETLFELFLLTGLYHI